jgi:pyruvate/2-oxoglutarate dehydrogenase complex dihydrolipoamide acyltransferase (E2) component
VLLQELKMADFRPYGVLIIWMIQTKTSWDDEPPSPKLLMPVSCTYDHRVIDGAGVAGFAQILQNKINDPGVLWN